MKTIPLCSRSGDVRALAMVDDDDFEVLSLHRWCLRVHGYAGRSLWVDGVSTNIFMHRVVLGEAPSPRHVVDHRDRNKLNNTRANLRWATPAQNNANMGRLSNNRSGFRGVYKAKRRWGANICVGYKIRRIGTFDTPEEAAAAYRKAAIAEYGEFAMGPST